MIPQIADRIRRPADLLDETLIVDQSMDFITPRPDWYAWFGHHGLPPPAHLGPKFSQSDHAVDAAFAGVGVVLGRRSVVVKDIAEGRLIAPFSTALLTGGHYRFLCPEGLQDRPHIRAFRDWIICEIAKTQAITDAMELRAI